MAQIKLTIDPSVEKGKINREIYGHFAEHLGRCIYNGLYVGENSKIPNINGVREDIIQALKKIRIPVLRWPGGCFADEYHWMDGIGPKQNRKKIVNTNWGSVVEDNSFGTNEFLNLCELLECQPYIAGNLGSGSVLELSQWVEYITFDSISPMAQLREKNGRHKPWRLKYLGIGNESWGCGGNMRAQYYCDLYKQYQTFCKNFGENQLFKVACGPNGDDYNWTEVLMQNLNQYNTNAISLHYYTVPSNNWSKKGSALNFSKEEYYSTISNTLYMQQLIEKHSEIMDKYDPQKNIGLIVDEWGCWYDVEEGTNPGFLYQQNSMRDALVASINLNIFNNHCERVVMANIAQLVNVLQALILTEGEKMVLTPTYHVFDMYKEHQDATLLKAECEQFNCTTSKYQIPALSYSCSMGSDSSIFVTISNCSLDRQANILADLKDFKFSKIKAEILSAHMGDHNDFDNPQKVKPNILETSPTPDGLTYFRVPPCSIAAVKFIP